MQRSLPWFRLLVALQFLSLPVFLVAQGTPTAALSLTSSASRCQPFVSNPLYSEGSSPSAVAVGDFNGDGIPDLVTAGWFTHNLYVLLGRKDGTFAKGQSVSDAADFPRKLVVGDFNNDGKLDVAIADEGGSVDVLLGNGDGTFQPALRSGAGNAVEYIAVGDFNHDGKLDIAAVAFGLTQVQVMLGKGDGTFRKPINYSTSLPFSVDSVAVADFNGDGNLDLAVTNSGTEQAPGNSVSVFFGKGDGGFGSPKEFTVGEMPFSITAADFNGDGKIDLAIANLVDGTASVLLNKGNGEFRPATSYSAGHPFAPSGIAAISFESGSAPGLAISGVAGVFVLANKGDGTFTSAQGYNPPSSHDPVVADFNGDGKADLALAIGFDDQASGIAVLFGKGHGVFSTSTAYPALPTIDAVAAGDFNQDGKPDLAVADTFNGVIAVMAGDGRGHFSEPGAQYPVGYPVAIAAGQFRPKGKLDLAVLSWQGWNVQIFLGKGDGSFSQGQTVPLSAIYPAWITLADFNGDGILDMAVTSAGDYADQGAVSILIGKGDGTFEDPVPYGSGNYLRGALFGDFNGDGKLDFALPRYDDKDLVIFLGKGDGTFREGAHYSLGTGPDSTAVGDFNGDGKLDLAVSLNDGTNKIWLGNGDGTFQAGKAFAGGGVLTAADLNRDGKVDLVTVDAAGLVQVQLGNGDGTFRSGNATYFGGGGGLGGGFTLADLNGDGAIDMATAGDDAGAVSVLLNRCSQ
jgi:hypothetical protein